MMRYCWFAFLLPGILTGADLPNHKPTPDELRKAYAEADRLPAEWNPKAFKLELNPHWITGTDCFWYRNDLAKGEREFILVDAAKGTRQPAFDAEKLAKAVSEANGPKLIPKKWPFDSLEYRDGLKKIRFQLGRDVWTFDMESGKAVNDGPMSAPKAKQSKQETDDEEAGDDLTSQPGGPKGPPRGPRTYTIPSPDGKWTVFQKENNLFLKPKDGDEKPLTTDGTASLFYGTVAWSPDSKTISAYKIELGENKEVWYVESSPKEGGRAKLHSHVYPVAGDKFTSYEGWLFDPATMKATKIDAEKIDFHTPRPRWSRDGKRFIYEKTDRGHQRFRIIETDVATGKTRTLFDDHPKTFVNQYANFTLVYADATDEIIASSERDGWNHLYLIDSKAGTIKNQITKGEFVVRGIENIDFDKRTLIFRACGKNTDQDPYFIHQYRVSFDGTGLIPLTEGNGTHTLKWSPDRKHYVDTWSRIDLPPVHELRKAADGEMVCLLETGDVSALKDTGWKMPEVFVAKGRDDKTDIWGMVTRPRNFDPSRKYPVIEYIYAGPHDSFVPKAFRTVHGRQSLAEFGFIVVQCDGMGTLNRSKAFHDVCWKNIGDAGFPDRIAWIKALAAKHPQVDASRVGIYGTSAGGQSSTGALLFHGDFYKVAVSSCGCHDNRMDKSSWNEQWMGVPVGPHYEAQSNITNAHKLQGKLMLIVGEMDTNVPPESTYRLADALIKAKKDFDFLMVPGMGHSDGGAYGERRRRDFFVRHLHGMETPDWNNMGGLKDK
ncbi:S9 family peptidase [Zavarzinella formosa]|uniref:S9 family peptidase n=1 Tax=Zavarzinella formosa TaxID=360055 RepID=UPI00090779E3|nr:prolyl oligopeptidase family serine peptidase [Zavarzinella formosa]